MSETRPITFTSYLPELIHPGEYESLKDRKLVRVQIQIEGGQIRILGDSPFGPLLEELLSQLSPGSIEAMLCG